MRSVEYAGGDYCVFFFPEGLRKGKQRISHMPLLGDRDGEGWLTVQHVIDVKVRMCCFFAAKLAVNEHGLGVIANE